MSEHLSDEPLTALERLRERRERFAERLHQVSILPVEIIDNVYYIDFDPAPEEPEAA